MAKAIAKKAIAKTVAATKVVAATAAAGAPAKAPSGQGRPAARPPGLDRERRTVGEPDMVPMPPSSLVPGHASAARSGADELRVKLAYAHRRRSGPHRR